MNNCDIKLEQFAETDFDRLISWVKDEKELILFAGPIFSFPLTKEQLRYYLADNKRHAFKIVHGDTNTAIGHCEAYQTDEKKVRLCRILIGNKNFRQKGYGTLLTKLITKWSFDNLQANFVDLSVYDFNVAAIKCYERVGFKKIPDKSKITEVENEKWASSEMIISRQEFYDSMATLNS